MITKTYCELSAQNGCTLSTKLHINNALTEYATIITYIYRVY